MKKTLLISCSILFCVITSFAGGPAGFSTSWTPGNLFVTATNGAVTTGTITVTSTYNTPNGNTLIPTSPSVSYISGGFSPLSFPGATFFHTGGVSSVVTSVLGYSINLSINTILGTVTGTIQLQNNSGGNYTGSLPFTIVTKGGRPFVTEWDLSLNESSPQEELNFTIEQYGTDPVNYSWATIPVASVSGAGTFTGGTIYLSGLPSGKKISLSIDGSNLSRFTMENSTDGDRLTNVAQWGDVVWSTMQYMFWSCTALQISATDVPNMGLVSDMYGMFIGCSSLNSPTNIGTWNTSNITNMSHLFNGASVFNQSIGGWNTSSVVGMTSMFYAAAAFNQPIGNWNTSNVTDMNVMFYNAGAFNQSVSGWNISKVTNMNHMFSGAYSFNQNLAAWGTRFNSSVVLTNFLENSGISTSNYDAILEGFSATTVTGRNMGAKGLHYCTGAGFRAILTSSTGLGGKGWTITDEGNAPTVGISTQPSSQTKCPDNNALLSVSAVGANLKYLWSNGMTGRVINPGAAGTYMVTVIGSCSTPISVVSNVVTVTNYVKPQIVAQPQSVSLCGQNTAIFNISAPGSTAYQWIYVNKVNSNSNNFTSSLSVTGFDTLSLTVPGVVSNGWNQYYVRAQLFFGNSCYFESQDASIYTNSLPTIVGVTPSLTLCPGGSIAVGATISGAYTSLSWSNNTTTTSFNTTTPGSYVLTVNNVYCSAISNPVTLSNFSETTILQPITNQSITSGMTASLVLSATGSMLTYTWSSGETTTGISGKTAGAYTVTVNGACGAVVQSATILEIAVNTLSSSIITVTGISASENIINTTNPISITISGQGFATGANVSINGIHLLNVIVISNNTLVATIPSGVLSSSIVGLTIQNFGENSVTFTGIIIVQSSVTSFSHQNTNKGAIHVHPNPCIYGSITIENASVGDDIVIFNSLGTVVYRSIISSSLEHVSLGLSPGIYVLRIGVNSTKLIVQ